MNLTALPVLLSSLTACRSPGAHGALRDICRDLEAEYGGRLGVFLLNADTGRSFGYRADERFALCSTFKFLLAAYVLQEADRGKIALDDVILIDPAAVTGYAPVTRAVEPRGSLTVFELIEAVQVHSDNGAANLLLDLTGGPKAFTARIRETGDTVTRLDRREPELNIVPEGEVRDTTSPAAFAQTVAHFLTGPALSPASQATLFDLSVQTQTGLKRLRSGLPEGWSVGDKTGTGIAAGMRAKYNDVAVIRRDNDPSTWVVSVFFETATEETTMTERYNALFHDLGVFAGSVIIHESKG